MHTRYEYAVVGIPLSRPEIVDYLLPPRPKPRGTVVQIIGQRPRAAAEAAWIRQLEERPGAESLCAIDDPHGHLTESPTDRLVPLESLAEPGFLTRDLGGWVANYFGVLGLPPNPAPDPLLQQLETLQHYGPTIRFFGADPALIVVRVEEETGRSLAEVISALRAIHQERRRHISPDSPLADRLHYLELLYAKLVEGNTADRQVPDPLLLDELMGQLVQLESERRAALFRRERRRADHIAAWQAKQVEQLGLRLILQAQYIVGRHRRSTVMLAPELGVVVKQPAPEPFHEIELAAREALGRLENWPYTTHDGALVTPRGRIRLTLKENLVPRISRACDYPIHFSSLLGLTVEPFIEGQTVMDAVLADPGRLTPQLYAEVLLHQQICEVLGIENGDWHAPNFVIRGSDDRLFHVDWGAARPLRDGEYTPEAIAARVRQVSNMAFSFRDESLAARLKQIHRELIEDPERMERLRRRAEQVASRAG